MTSSGYGSCMATVTFTSRYINGEGRLFEIGDTTDVDDDAVQRLINIGVVDGKSDTVWTDPRHTPARKASKEQWVKYAALVEPGFDAESASKADLIDRFGEPSVR